MAITDCKRFLPSFGSLMVLTLMGILLLSALLYYRAVKIQRFSEPALALSQPRMEFGQKIIGLFAHNFQEKGISGISFTTDAIYIDESRLLLIAPLTQTTPAPIVRELASTFRAILENPELRSYIDFILISSVRIIEPGKNLSTPERSILQNNSEFILKSLFLVEPQLERQFASFFASTVKISSNPNARQQMIEFRFIPTERLHIDFLTKLQKYTD